MREVREDPEELGGVGRGVPDGEGLATALQGAKELSPEVNVKTRPSCGAFPHGGCTPKENRALAAWRGLKQLTWKLVPKNRWKLVVLGLGWYMEHMYMLRVFVPGRFHEKPPVQTRLAADGKTGGRKNLELPPLTSPANQSGKQRKAPATARDGFPLFSLVFPCFPLPSFA